MLERDKTYNLDEFMSLQAEKCGEAEKGLILLRENIIVVVLGALKVSAWINLYFTFTHTQF